MANSERLMPEHIGAAYRDAADNIIFLKRQQEPAPTPRQHPAACAGCWNLLRSRGMRNSKNH
jgi:hypothetical protein